MKLRAAVELWTSPADRRAPFGACGQPVDNVLGQVAVDRRIERLDDDLGTRHGGAARGSLTTEPSREMEPT